MAYATLPPTVKDRLGAQFLLDAHCAVAGIGERMVEHGLLDLSRHPERSLGPGRRSISPSAKVNFQWACDFRATAFGE